MVKYTTPLPYIGLSESDSELYTNIEFCDLQNQAYYFDKIFKEKSTFFRRWCK